MTKLSCLELLLPLVGYTLQPLLPLLQLPNLHSVCIGSCQSLGGGVLQPLGRASNLRQLNIQVGRLQWELQPGKAGTL